MQLRLSVVTAAGVLRPIRVSCDVTATVSDVARACARAGLFREGCAPGEETRMPGAKVDIAGPLTLLGSPNGTSQQVLLDPCAPVARSGLQSGWTVEAVSERNAAAHAPRLVAPQRRGDGAGGTPAPHGTAVLHTRAPRVQQEFPRSERTLPTPPAPARPAKLPLLGLVAPALLGLVMYIVTGSPLSLIMIAFTPLLALGAWLDGRFGGRRAFRAESRAFVAALQAEQTILQTLQKREIAERCAESPDVNEVARVIETRGLMLWSRRPEHSEFLSVQLGEGHLPSRTRLRLPERGHVRAEHWAKLGEYAANYQTVGPVPLSENLTHSGSIGIAGDQHWALGSARALLMQIAALHSPTEVTFVCFAGASTDRVSAEDWEWLAWLPHVDPPHSPLLHWPLASEPAAAARLLSDLERVLAERCAAVIGDTPPCLPRIIVVVHEPEGIDLARLIALAERGPRCGIHLIWVTAERKHIPAACRTLIEIERGSGRVHLTLASTSVQLSRCAFVEAPLAEALARSLAPVEDTAQPTRRPNDLPPVLALRDVHPVDLRGGGRAILRAWRESGSLIRDWIPGSVREPVNFSAVLGQCVDGPLALDLREQGPHALVGGTTGSGKSELLQSWIMSLAAQLSPERITFLLVDYKGGAAFAECAQLPHTVGLVTDLDTHLVRRALTSLRAELRRREELFAQLGAKDLITLERRSEPAAPPALVIVIDEFAALARDCPEFIEGIVDIGQRGRSLGLHLILATQRPAGVITDHLRANTPLRVALRMADVTDSSDVLGSADAAHFDHAHPGRAAVRFGAGQIEHFQSGYLGGHPARNHSPEVQLHELGFRGSLPLAVPVEAAAPVAPREQPRDIVELLAGIGAAAESARIPTPQRPWLDPLPDTVWLTALPIPEVSAGQRDPSGAVRIGLSDLPQMQRQTAFTVDFDLIGNLALVGASGTGKSNALVTIAAALSEQAAAVPVQIYAIDAAGGALAGLSTLPTVGAVAPLTDPELVGRVLRHVSAQVAKRAEQLRASRGHARHRQAESPRQNAEPRIFLLVDGFAALRSASEASLGSDSTMRMLSEIMQAGRAAGVHVVLSADRPGVIPATLAASVQLQLVFRLANAFDYAQLGVSAEVLVNAPPGRAVCGADSTEIQLATLASPAAPGDQLAALADLAASLRAQGVARVTEVRNAPAFLPLQEVPVGAEFPMIGIGTRDLDPVCMPVRGLAVVSGPAGSGLTTSLQTLLAAHARWAQASERPVERILLSMDEDSLLLGQAWNRVAAGEEQVLQLASELAGQLPAQRAGAAQHLQLVVIEQVNLAEHTAALAPLVAMVKAARRSAALVMVECEASTGAGMWEFVSELKHARWGVLLQPDESDAGPLFRQHVGRARRADSSPGRGLIIDNGRALPVQLAFPWGILGDRSACGGT